ncbi:hypothetical protein PBAC_23360 [Pedobacter glucosidilyticus]|nr:hypothetical protein [Pedobacter glucosidilyticus]KHJ37492.1 hypothetical protein PBAC_23360 [Pedobacter glucosidilyticus]
MKNQFQPIHHPSTHQEKEFREFIRMDNTSQIWQLYRNCRQRLLMVNDWGKHYLQHLNAQFILHDSFGYEVQRTAQVGDYIKILNNCFSQKNIFWLEIESIAFNHEFDSSEESVIMNLKTADDPKYQTDSYSKLGVERCMISIRRVLNTILAHIKVNEQTTTPNFHSSKKDIKWLYNFKWDYVLKDITC